MRNDDDRSFKVVMFITFILLAFIMAIWCMYEARLDMALVLFAVSCFAGYGAVTEMS